MQAAFTIKELRELLTLPSVAFDKIPADLMPSSAQVSTLPRQQKRIAQLLAKGSSNEASSSAKSWSLDFLLSPTRFRSSTVQSSTLDSVSFTRNQYRPEANPSARGAAVEPKMNSSELNIRTRLAFRSVGYKSEPLPSLDKIGVPFDYQKGIIPNDVCGRVLADPEDTGAVGAPEPVPRHVPGMYCAGWVKRGPTGVIAATMEDAFATADALARDWEVGVPFISSESTAMGWDGIEADGLSQNLRQVTWADWRRIDEAEKARGQKEGKEREKIVDVIEMLRVLDG